MLWKINKYIRMQYILIIGNHFKAESSLCKNKRMAWNWLIYFWILINQKKKKEKNEIRFRENLSTQSLV